MKFQFGDFSVDESTRQLLRKGRSVHLSPKAFALLVTLIRERPRALRKEELHAQLWPNTFVSDASLAMLIAEVRAALGESARQPRWVRTIHRHGYAFQEEASDASPDPDQPIGYWLITPTRQIALLQGDNIVGREPDARVWLDEPSVSRRHATIRVTASQITLEDLNSKNGTHVRDVRVSAPTPLNDGDEVRFGSVNVTLRASSSDPTKTEAGSS